jgi:hypothetical protein
MKFMRIWVAAAAIAGLARGVQAASPADIASGLAPEVLQVVSGGSWENAGKKGGYRAVLVASSTGSDAELYIEWLAAGSNGQPPSLVMSLPVKEINDLKLPNATLNAEFEAANEYTVFVEADDPSKDSGKSYTVLAGPPGKYTFSLGAPPE